VRFRDDPRPPRATQPGCRLFFWTTRANRSHDELSKQRVGLARIEPPRISRLALVPVTALLIVGVTAAETTAKSIPATAGPTSAAHRVVRTHHVMGTRMVTTIEASTRQSALAASETAYKAIADAERRLSTWTTSSELSHVNASPVGEPVEVSAKLGRDLRNALRCAQETDGAFTPGIGGLVEAWNLREGGRRPSLDELRLAVSGASLDNVRLVDDRVARLDARFFFEEGAFGKGAGLDDALERLASTAAKAAVIDLGGQIAVWGQTSAWVDIAHPRDRDRAILRLEISRGSVATSGSSERGVVVDGERLGHVLDPRSGLPSGDFGSVTVWADDAARADCLSTALFVFGSEAAHAWASERPELGVVTVTYEGDRLLATATPNLRGRLVTTTDEVVIHWFDSETAERTLRPSSTTQAAWPVDGSAKEQRP
jgi:thiamine biosynthesis lipoprotein